MKDSENWRETKYRECLEAELRGLERRLAYDPRCTAEELEATLKHLYAASGADWAGRGEVQNTGMDAVIAAHEQIISRLREKKV